jgi:hypothetical protein
MRSPGRSSETTRAVFLVLLAFAVLVTAGCGPREVGSVKPLIGAERGIKPGFGPQSIQSRGGTLGPGRFQPQPNPKRVRAKVAR